MQSILYKECRCGQKSTHGFPQYCDDCCSFTHMCYTRIRDEARNGESNKNETVAKAQVVARNEAPRCPYYTPG
jgi:hypothetical protein